MNQEKKENLKFSLPKKYIFFIIIFGIIFVSASVIFFKGESLNNYKIKQDNQEKSLSQELLKENLGIANLSEDFNVGKLRVIDKSDHVLGDMDSKIKVIYYNDFDAPFNEDLFNIINKIREEFEDISIAYRHFPMRTNVSSLSAALASECASEQNKFWEMAEMLIQDKNGGMLDEETYLSRAEELNLDIEKFQLCLNEEKYLDKIKKQAKEAESFGVMGAPTIFVNDIILPGAYPFEDFVDSSDRERKGLKSIIEGEMKAINQ